MKTRRWMLLLLIMVVAMMSMATYTGVTRSLFTDGEVSTNDALGIRWGLGILIDSFDGGTWDANWDENGATAWVQDGTNPRTGANSAFSDRNSPGLLTTDDFDTVDASDIVVSFWFRGKSLATGDFLFQLYNGVSYDTQDDLTALIAVDDTWYQYNLALDSGSNPTYFFSGFHVRFDTTPVGGSKNASVDDVVISTDSTPPTNPTGLGATPGDSQVVLDWADNGEGDLAGYNVYRSLTSGSGYVKINGSLVSPSAYTDDTPPLTNGTEYFYVVTAVDTSTNESGNSNEANSTPADAIPPANAAGLGATPGDGQVALSWTANTEPDLAGYYVYRSTDSGGSPTPYSQVNGLVGTNSYTDVTVSNGTEYFYVVTAVDTSTNESVGYSNEASATPVAGPLLDDGFDFPTWDGNWDGNGATSWMQDATPVRTGSYSATSDKSSSGLLTSDDLSTSGAVSITVSFWYYSKAIDAGDVLVKVSNDGSAWNTPWTLLTGGDLTTDSGFAHNTWVFFSETIAGPYIDVAYFSLRFDSTALADGGEAINIDDVLITVN